MKAGIAMTALACLMLAGCDKPPAPAPKPTAAPGPDPIEAKLAALPEGLRNATLYRAVLDANYPCERVTKVESRPRMEGQPAWTVTCDNGPDYGIVLQRGGIFQVTGVPKAPRP